jgi:hypothetical protein
VFPIAWSSKLGSVGRFLCDFIYKPTSMLLPLKSHNLFLSFLLQLINYLTCSTMFLVPNIDQMYKEMKKIVEVGNKNELPDFADLFFFCIKNVRVSWSIVNTHIIFFGLTKCVNMSFLICIFSA